MKTLHFMMRAIAVGLVSMGGEAGVAWAAEGLPATTAATQASSLAAAKFELAAAAARQYFQPQTNDYSSFRGAVYDLVRVHGAVAADRLVDWYEEPALERGRTYLAEAIAQQSTEKTRAMFLRLIEVPQSAGIIERFLGTNFLDYDDEQKKVLAQRSRKVLEAPTRESHPSPGMALYLLGLNGEREDMPLVVKTVASADKNLGLQQLSRQVLARLGDEAAHAAVLAQFEAKAPEYAMSGLRPVDTMAVQISQAMVEVRYIGRREDIPVLMRFIDDKRVGITQMHVGNATDWVTGRALDVEAAEAIYAMVRPSPRWPLTAPEGKVVGKGTHPNSGETFSGQMRTLSGFETLSAEQSAEIKAWVKEHVPAGK